MNSKTIIPVKYRLFPYVFCLFAIFSFIAILRKSEFYGTLYNVSWDNSDSFVRGMWAATFTVLVGNIAGAYHSKHQWQTGSSILFGYCLTMFIVSLVTKVGAGGVVISSILLALSMVHLIPYTLWLYKGSASTQS